MVNERLVWYLEKDSLLAKKQCGYRSNRWTVDHLLCLETFIRDAFVQNQHLIAVSLIYKRHMIQHENMVSYKIYMTWAYTGISPFI